MKRKFFKSLLALAFILFNIILISSCSKKDTTLKLKDDSGNEYVVEKTEDTKEVQKVIKSMSGLDVSYQSVAELNLLYDGSFEIEYNNYILNFTGNIGLDFGIDLSKMDIVNNEINENFECYFDLDASLYLDLLNNLTNENFYQQLISLPLKIQTKNGGDFVFINLGNKFYISPTILDYFLSDNMKILASYQSYLKNSKIAILKTKALEEINKTPLLDKSYTIIENNDSFGVFGALINTLNVTYYDIKITEVKDNLVTFSLDANKISNITNSTTSSTLYITFDTSYMLPTYIKVDNFTSNGKIKDIFNLPLELNNSNIEIEIRYNTYTQPDIDISGYEYM